MSQPRTADHWYQIVLDDPTAISGESLVHVMRLMLRHFPCDAVAVYAADWLREGFRRPGETPEEIPILDAERVFARIGALDQVDFGDFFFCRNHLQAQKITSGESMAASISKSVFTVSAIDNTYIYLYTRDSGIKTLINAPYRVLEVNEGALESFVYPY